MRRKLPDCPKCGLDELWLRRHKFWLDVMCYWCGEIATITPPPAEADLDTAIAEAVARAQPIAPTQEP